MCWNTLFNATVNPVLEFNNLRIKSDNWFSQLLQTVKCVRLITVKLLLPSEESLNSAINRVFLKKACDLAWTYF